MPPLLANLSLKLFPLAFKLFRIHFDFPLCARWRSYGSQVLLRSAAFARPLDSHAMRLPAPQSFPKWNVQTNLRSARLRSLAPSVPCRCVIVRCYPRFRLQPAPSRQSGMMGIPDGPQSSRTLPDRNSPYLLCVFGCQIFVTSRLSG